MNKKRTRYEQETEGQKEKFATDTVGRPKTNDTRTNQTRKLSDKSETIFTQKKFKFKYLKSEYYLFSFKKVQASEMRERLKTF